MPVIVDNSQTGVDNWQDIVDNVKTDDTKYSWYHRFVIKISVSLKRESLFFNDFFKNTDLCG